jgi:hypothetical protein
VVWTSPDTKTSIVINTGSDGMPESAVVGDDVILYSDFTDDMVDLTIVHADGSTEGFHAKRNTDILNKLSELANPALSLISYSLPFAAQPVQVDVLELIKTIAKVAAVASCIVAIGGAIAGGPLAALALPCIGPLLAALILAGKELGLDVSVLEEMSNSWTAFKCPFALLNPIDFFACFSTAATAIQKIIEFANQKVEVANPHPGGLQQGTFSFDITATSPPPVAVSSLRGTVNRRSNCRYGPGAPYQYKYGVNNGTPMEVIGRDADGNWLKVQGVGGHNPCWIKAEQIDAGGDVMVLPDAYPQNNGLPISPYFPQIAVTSSSSGGHVTVEWPQHAIRADLNTEEGIEYIVEVWTCVDGKPNFTPIGIGVDQVTMAEFDIDSSCGFASHADLIGEDKEGFSPPTLIAVP